MGTSREEEYRLEVDSYRIRPGGLSSIFSVWLSLPLPPASSYVVRARGIDRTYIITIKQSRRRNACSFEEVSRRPLSIYYPDLEAGLGPTILMGESSLYVRTIAIP